MEGMVQGNMSNSSKEKAEVILLYFMAFFLPHLVVAPVDTEAQRIANKRQHQAAIYTEPFEDRTGIPKERHLADAHDKAGEALYSF